MSRKEWGFLEGRWLPWPVPWHDYFGRSAPLLVEIGFGNGQFLLDLAARREEANIVGVEISQPSLRSAQRKVSSQQRKNVLLVHALAGQALWTLCAPQSLSGVFINFPDPWPKASHRSRRLIDQPFLSLLAARLHPQAMLDIATDDAQYALEIARHLASHQSFDSRLPTPYVHEDNTRLRTKYESLARAQGRLCYYFKWRRNKTPGESHYPPPRELAMPHLILSSAPHLSAVARAFEPATHSGEWGTVRFIGMFEARDYESLLVDTFIDEIALTQRLGLTIRARGEDALIIGVHELGFPRATPAVHHAIHCLASDLIQRHPYMQILSSNIKL